LAVIKWKEKGEKDFNKLKKVKVSSTIELKNKRSIQMLAAIIVFPKSININFFN
jgi:hypothetical protein